MGGNFAHAGRPDQALVLERVFLDRLISFWLIAYRTRETHIVTGPTLISTSACRIKRHVAFLNETSGSDITDTLSPSWIFDRLEDWAQRSPTGIAFIVDHQQNL